MGGTEQKYLQQAFDNQWIAPDGPNVDAFELSLETYLGDNKHVVALSSGTAAIHLALVQLGVGPGDEVICQSLTFVASANPICYLGAKPVFIDSERESWNMDPNLLEEAISDRMKKTGKKPKAIIPVDLYGMPARMDHITEIALRHEVPVLEDAAEALGAAFLGRKCGTFGEFASLSFSWNKVITTSMGGALVCSTSEQAAKTRYYANQAKDAAPWYQHSEIGFNYRMSNICAGIGRGQMEMLDKYLTKRKEIHEYYRTHLADIPGITFLNNPTGEFDSSHWLTCILIDPEIAGFTCDKLMEAMEAANIETRLLMKPMHLQPVFKDAPFYGNGVSEYLFSLGLSLPSSQFLTEEDLDRVIYIINETSTGQ